MQASPNNHLYYRFKPLIPKGVRVALRRWRANRLRKQHESTWPILESAGQAPEGWQGWPGGKRFAFVLTHDVESALGLQRCPQLMDLTAQKGFRSAFNFVPEGEYRLPDDFRQTLVRNGFEVGVHDLRHDGKLYRTRKEFEENAIRINRYLKEWNACGFRSGFMHHNLDWLHELNVAYDASTFDTDPFEPQPDGVGTIFPFWVEQGGRRAEGGSQRSEVRGRRSEAASRGYVELPYTLIQDFNLFVVLQEKSIDIWKRKLDWIAARGGMALLIVHPDYVHFGSSSPSAHEFPSTLYSEFLDYVRTRYAGEYWQALPREIAGMVVQQRIPPPVHHLKVSGASGSQSHHANAA